jgi:hypothetical protein
MNVWAIEPDLKIKLKMVVAASKAKFRQIAVGSDRWLNLTAHDQRSDI